MTEDNKTLEERLEAELKVDEVSVSTTEHWVFVRLYAKENTISLETTHGLEPTKAFRVGDRICVEFKKSRKPMRLDR